MITFQNILEQQNDKYFQEMCLKVKYYLIDPQTDEKGEEKESIWIPKSFLFLLDSSYYKHCMEMDNGEYSISLDSFTESEEGLLEFLKDFINGKKINIDIAQTLNLQKFMTSLKFGRNFYNLEAIYTAEKIKELEAILPEDILTNLWTAYVDIAKRSRRYNSEHITLEQYLMIPKDLRYTPFYNTNPISLHTLHSYNLEEFENISSHECNNLIGVEDYEFEFCVKNRGNKIELTLHQKQYNVPFIMCNHNKKLNRELCVDCHKKIKIYEKEKERTTLIYCGKDDEYFKMEETFTDLRYLLDRTAKIQINNDYTFCFKF